MRRVINCLIILIITFNVDAECNIIALVRGYNQGLYDAKSKECVYLERENKAQVIERLKLFHIL